MALTACSGNSVEDKLAGKAVSKLEGTSWQLVVADAPKASDCENLPPVMDFLDAKRVSGNLGCNLFNTEYQLDGKKLTFKDAAVTRRMCAPEAMRAHSVSGGGSEAGGKARHASSLRRRHGFVSPPPD